MCCLQISVEAPWLSNVQESCTVIGKGMLTCVDPSAASLHMLDLHADSEMTQVLFQVSKVTILFCKTIICIVFFMPPLTLELFFFVDTVFAFFLFLNLLPFSLSSH